MRLSKDLINKPIYSVDDGRLLGQVKDIYVDENLFYLTAIFLGGEGLVRRKQKLIARSAVVVFGVDAVLVRSADAIATDRDTEDADSWLRVSDIRGREVDTPGGTKVATVGDLLFNEEARIVAIKFAKVFVEGPIAEKGMVDREAMVDSGQKDGRLTIDLILAEGGEPQPAPIVEPAEKMVPDSALNEEALSDDAVDEGE